MAVSRSDEVCFQPQALRLNTILPQLQVEVAVMEFRDELEGAGGLSRQQIDDRVRVKRAQLTVEAEREAAAASKDDGKASSRCGFFVAVVTCHTGRWHSIDSGWNEP